MPEVSVLMPVLNGQKYINECIKSILTQSFKNFEFIIINDGSTDKTEKIIKQWIKKDGRIKLINNKKSIGITKSLNKGLKIAKGKYIARQDADDVSLPERFEKQIKFLKARPEVKVLGTFAYITDKKGKILRKEAMPISCKEIKKTFSQKNPFFHPSVMMEKKFIKKLGGYDEKFAVFQDYDLWHRALKKGIGENLPQFLIKRRIHSSMVSIKKRQEQLKNAKWILSKH